MHFWRSFYATAIRLLAATEILVAQSPYWLFLSRKRNGLHHTLVPIFFPSFDRILVLACALGVLGFLLLVLWKAGFDFLGLKVWSFWGDWVGGEGLPLGVSSDRAF